MAAGADIVTARPQKFKIVGADGMPVAHASVSVVQSSVAYPEMAQLADADGTLTVRLPQGRFTLRAHTADGRSGQVTVSNPAESSSEIRIEVR